MTQLLFAIVAFVLVVVLCNKLYAGNKIAFPGNRRDGEGGEKYNYTKKKSIVTKRELDFYKRLIKLLDKRCYIFPQMHVSAFLNHRIKNQNWKGALSHINGKSVDFLLCEKETLEPICAIELDDSTHDREDRAKRDVVVETILERSKMPLIRFRNMDNITDKEIIDAIGDAVNSVKKTSL